MLDIRPEILYDLSNRWLALHHFILFTGQNDLPVIVTLITMSVPASVTWRLSSCLFLWLIDHNLPKLSIVTKRHMPCEPLPHSLPHGCDNEVSELGSLHAITQDDDLNPSGVQPWHIAAGFQCVFGSCSHLWPLPPHKSPSLSSNELPSTLMPN